MSPSLSKHPAVNTALTRISRQVVVAHGILGDKDPINDNCREKVVMTLASFAMAIGAVLEDGDIDCQKLKGLKILDIGCGAAHGDAPGPNGDMLRACRTTVHRSVEPWFCRTLSAAGAKVTGVDLFYPRYVKRPSSNREKREFEKRGERPPAVLRKGCPEPGWTFVQRDLQVPGALDSKTFPDESFDVVVSTYFIGHGEGSIRDIRDDNFVRDIQASSPEAYDAMLKEIKMQATRVLKPEGYCLWNTDLSRKINGELVRL